MPSDLAAALADAEEKLWDAERADNSAFNGRPFPSREQITEGEAARVARINAAAAHVTAAAARFVAHHSVPRERCPNCLAFGGHSERCPKRHTT